ncbi:hypothetical protein Bca4012_017777 [Brassica carinata]|uniref:Uncharacterized protein n=1 Tax=Brassica carinata TaxID=52824 RepID=A0A8X7WNI9_BRACI|nr:hypothetical protein Bca52824_003837 [Brassica carinata]
MAAEKKKHLRELLEDDQEPFHLNHYIADLRSQMGYSNLRVKKLKPQNAAVQPPGLFTCESSCFLATHHTNKFPLFELPSPPKKESSEGRVFLCIPARTAAILQEAAARIQKQQSEKDNKTNNRARNRGNAFGLFGSVLKLLTNRKAKPRLGNADANLVLSEPTSSSRRECLVEIGDKCFCESPFHFVLHATPSTSSHQTPHFTSTASSPARRSTEDEDSDETESLEKVRGQGEVDKEEEAKEECSPVSVFDPLEKEEDHHQREVPDHLKLLSCSFEVVQRAKRRLLKKLCRFDKLAGMDPVDLERKMSEEQQDEEKENEESEEEDNMRVYDTDEEYEDVDEAMARESGWVEEERRKKWRMMNAWRVGMGAEEAAEAVVQKDIRGEAGEWTRHRGEVEEAVSEIELSIFIFLIDEFSHELVSSCMNLY